MVTNAGDSSAGIHYEEVVQDVRAAGAMRLGSAAVLGCMLALGGLVMMAGWMFQRDAIVRIFPGFLMVFNTALGFTAAGVALAASSLLPGRRQDVQRGAGVGLALLGALVLAQYIFSVNLGIDWSGLHTWVADLRGNRYPGRMSAATSATFVGVGTVFFLASSARTTAHALLVRALTVAIGAVGAAALIGYPLNLPELLRIYWLTQVSVPTAAGFMLVAAGLWLSWRREPWNAFRLVRGDDSRIALAGALVLAASIAAVGAGVFWLMQMGMQRILTADLNFALKSREGLVGGGIGRALQATHDVADRPNIRRLYSAPSSDPLESNNAAFLPVVANSLLQAGFSAFAFYDAEGRELGRAGAFIHGSELRLPITHGESKAEIVWNGTFELQTRVDVVVAGKRFGEVRGQYRLAELDAAVADTAALGATSEFALCARREGKLHCAPTRFQPRPFDLPLAASRRLPVSLALEGESGVLKLTDYRGERVLAAFSPLGSFGLGAVLKTDLAEIYAPIRDRLHYLALILLFASAGGGWLLRTSVRPLLRRVVASEERLRTALEGSQLALWDWDVSTGKVYLSEQWSAMLGGVPRSVEITIGELSALVHPQDAGAVREHVRAMLKGTVSHYDVEHRMRTHAGEWKWILSRGRTALRGRDGRALRASGTYVDIHERKQLELQIAHRATHDTLTGLPNRSLFQDRLERALGRARRNRALMAVMYIDLDKFKAVNDTLGHAAGDMLLKQFARRLADCVRATDTVARLGGDEFAAILEGLVGRDDGLRIAGNIVAAMRPAFALDEGEAAVSASLGIAFHDGVAEMTPGELLKVADRAVYEAKASGRDRFCVAAP